MTQFDAMMRAAHKAKLEERDSVKRDLNHCMKLVRTPSDDPEADRREIYSRLIRASDFLGRAVV